MREDGALLTGQSHVKKQSTLEWEIRRVSKIMDLGLGIWDLGIAVSTALPKSPFYTLLSLSSKLISPAGKLRAITLALLNSYIFFKWYV